jgi:large subunit ribosomal protein L32e
VEDLQGIDPKVEAARIGGTVGTRKRREIVESADKLGIRVLNRGVL